MMMKKKVAHLSPLNHVQSTHDLSGSQRFHDATPLSGARDSHLRQTIRSLRIELQRERQFRRELEQELRGVDWSNRRSFKDAHILKNLRAFMDQEDVAKSPNKVSTNTPDELQYRWNCVKLLLRGKTWVIPPFNKPSNPSSLSRCPSGKALVSLEHSVGPMHKSMSMMSLSTRHISAGDEPLTRRISASSPSHTLVRAQTRTFSRNSLNNGSLNLEKLRERRGSDVGVEGLRSFGVPQLRSGKAQPWDESPRPTNQDDGYSSWGEDTDCTIPLEQDFDEGGRKELTQAESADVSALMILTSQISKKQEGEEECEDEIEKAGELVLKLLEPAMSEIEANNNDTLAKMVLKEPVLRIFSCAALSMRSENHQACLPVLTALTDYAGTIQIAGNGLIELVAEKLSESFAFLYSVSPVLTNNRPGEVWQIVSANLNKLYGINILQPIQLPYYTINNPSPVFTRLLTYHERLTAQFKTWKKANPKKANPKIISPSEELGQWDLYSALGNEHVKDVRADQAEENSDKRIEICSKLLKEGIGCENPKRKGGLTAEVMRQLHSSMDLGEDVAVGEFRKETIVGSFMYFASYRVFLPCEEVPRAMENVLRVATTTILHPAVLSYYLFSSLVFWIHPYEDGNGRMSRVLANLVLKRASLPLALTFKDKVLTFEDFLGRL